MSQELPDDYYEPTICKTPLPKIRISYEQLESALAAEQDARKAAECKLSLYSLTPANYEWTITQLSQRAEAAEAIIKASREQEPVGRCCRIDGLKEIVEMHPNFVMPENQIQMQLYAQPPIPPDVAELQRENAQLTAELHSMNVNFSGMLEDRNKYKRENAELQRQLEEASKDAARYKWLRNNTKGFASFHLFAYNSTLPDDMFDCAVDSAMISAAPTTDQPKE